MKLRFFSIMILAATAVTGCFTAATAWTEKTTKDGATLRSHVSVIGTGDKVSEMAAEGMFADGTAEDLGAGVKKANASQQSTGIGETINAVGTLLGGVAKVMASSQGVKVPAAAAATDTSTDTAEDSTVAVTTPVAAIVYNTDGYGGSPGANGEGIYGKPSCSRCRAYHTAHPDVQIINIEAGNGNAELWNALRARGYASGSVNLPVSVTEAGFTQAAK